MPRKSPAAASPPIVRRRKSSANDVPVGTLRQSGSRALEDASENNRIALAFGWVIHSLAGIDGDVMVDALLRMWDDADADRKVAYIVEATEMNTADLESGMLGSVLARSGD